MEHEGRAAALGSREWIDRVWPYLKVFGGMLAFEVEGGIDAGRRLLESLCLVTHAVSLGGVETLAVHPASTTHAPLTPEERRRAGVSDGLIRVSVGLEDVADVIADFEQALTASTSA